MSATDELRDWAYNASPVVSGSGISVYVGKLTGVCRNKLLAIADAIDDVHSRELSECAERWHKAGYHDGFEEGRSEEFLKEDGWVRLPRDASGEVWHVGDRTTSGGVVQEIKLNGDNLAYEDMWTLYVSSKTNDCQWLPFRPTEIRHYHEPTLRDTLLEVMLKCVTIKGHKAGVPVVGVDEDMLDEWLEENPGTLIRIAGGG